jgi:hypothetical protein
MKLPSFVARAMMIALLVLAAVAAHSCDSVSGVGMGVGTTSRWGGGSSSPPVFVGGPSF